MSAESLVWVVVILLVACCVVPMILMAMQGRRAKLAAGTGVSERHAPGNEARPEEPHGRLRRNT